MNLRGLSDLAGNSRGSAVVELGLIAPVIATMLIGVIDLTTAFNRKLELEQAVQRSIERVMQTTADTTVEDSIKQEVADAAGIDKDNVTVTYTLTCNGVSKPWEEDCASGESEVRYLNVEAYDTFTPLIPLSSLGFESDHFLLTVESGIRTR